MSDTHDERGGDEAAVCSTSCDPDCDAVCHEDHVEGHKKQHWPYDCPAADRYFDEYFRGADGFVAEVIKRLRGERDEARQQLAAATARAEKAEAERDRERSARQLDDRHIDRTLALLLMRQGGAVEFSLSEMESAPQHGEFMCIRNLTTGGTRLAFQAAGAKAADAAQDGLSEPVERSETLPESLSGPQTCSTRHVHDGLMHICSLATGHDTHMCVEGDLWTTSNDTTEDGT